MTSKKQASAPILTLPEPCDKPWKDMQGGHATRFCDSCSKDVHNLSDMTKKEALALLDSHDWDICVNYEVSHKGQMLFQPEPPSKLQMQIAGAQKLLAAAALITPMALLSACDEHSLRMGGDPVAVSAEATPVTPIQPGGVKPVEFVKHSPPEDAEPPACDESTTEEDEHTSKKEDVAKVPMPKQERHRRLGGAPMKLDFKHVDTTPAP